MSDSGSESSKAKEEKGLPQIESGIPQTSPAELTIGCSRWLSASKSFIYVEVSSLILLFACIAAWRRTSLFRYAISVASVSFGICLFLQTMEFLKPGFLKKPAIGNNSVEKLSSMFLFLWWLVGASFITFSGPFVYTSNGWFGAWLGLIFSCKWCIGLDFVSYSSQSRKVKYLINLVLFAIVAIVASIAPLRRKSARFEGAGLAVAAGAITLIVCAYLIGMYKEVSKKMLTLSAGLLFVLWTITAGVCTYIGPFILTGNGFFAVWLSALCALKIVMM